MNCKKEVIAAERLKKVQGSRQVLSDAWMKVLEGQSVGIAGLDGAGRTLLMKIIAGVEEQDSGNLYLNGNIVNKQNEKLLKEMVAYITHESNLVDNLAMIDNLYTVNSLPGNPWYVSYRNIKEECRKKLNAIQIHQNVMRKCSLLEDNEKQRLEIVKAIMAGARVIILNCIESIYSEEDLLLLKKLMDSMKEKGISFIFVSNQLDYLIELSDLIFVMKEGRTVKEIQKKNFYKKHIYSLMSGYSIDDRLEIAERDVGFGEEVLRLESVYKGELKGISLAVKSKEIVGILSLSSRWTENLIDVLLGNEKIESGDIYRNGRRVNRKYLMNRSTLKNRCCIVPHPDLKGEIFENLTPQQNYLLLAQQKTTLLPLGIVSKRVEKHLNNTDIKELGFTTDIFKKSISELTGRDRFELVIGRIRLFKPELLIMNSPIEVADIFLKKQVTYELSKMAARGTGILITGANYKELTIICDKILFQRNGRIVGSIDKSEFMDVRLESYLN